MQDVDNHMDELFRKAAASYPLKTGDSDWDKIVTALPNNTGTTMGNTLPPAVPYKKNRFGKYGGLLLLPVLLLLFGGVFTDQHRNSSLPGLYRPIDYNKHITIGEATHLNKKATGVSSNRKAGNSPANPEPGFGIKKEEQAYSHKQNIIYKDRAQWLVINHPADNKPNEIRTGDHKPGLAVTAIQPVRSYSLTNGLIAGCTLPGGIIPHTDATTDHLLTKSLQKKHAEQRQRGIYWGIVLGPSFSQVKNQEWRKPGFDAGIIGGYQFNSKMRLETGFLFSKKYYYSDGKYFSMNKAGDAMPAGMKILSLEGSSSLFEIPVKFNYSIWQRPKSNLFVAAGLSSYIMTREKNNYQTMMNGTQSDMTGYYKNVSRYAAVVLGISAGYEFKAGRSVRIRIEPYVKIPLKGIGIGAMPVTSTGVHIGLLSITR